MAKEQFQRTKPHVNIARQRWRLQEAGMSLIGIEQLLSGQLISSPSDRALVAEIVVSAMDDTSSLPIRTMQPNTPGSM